MLGRIKDTVEDVAETIKRAFVGPAVHSAPQFFIETPVSNAMSLPVASTLVAPLTISANISVASLLLSAPVSNADVQFRPRVLLETGEAFKANAKLVSIPLAWSGVVKSAEIPRMNAPAVRGVDDSYSVFKTEFYVLPQFSLKLEKTYKLNTSMNTPRCFASVETALSRPIGIQSENVEKISKALLMRYTIQLVKETRENIRNLEIIGLYSIPKKGVRAIKRDASAGLLRILVGPEAQNSEYNKLMLARKKSDSTIVSCVVNPETE